MATVVPLRGEFHARLFLARVPDCDIDFFVGKAAGEANFDLDVSWKVVEEYGQLATVGVVIGGGGHI